MREEDDIRGWPENEGIQKNNPPTKWAHQTEGSTGVEKNHPDFPEWIESEEGKGCMRWPISEPLYLNNRLFWAFDAGRNCVWDQFMKQKNEHAACLAALKELIEMLESERGFYNSEDECGLLDDEYNRWKSAIERAKTILDENK